ncbi:hypothetical protein [Paraburkholderia youngii]
MNFIKAAGSESLPLQNMFVVFEGVVIGAPLIVAAMPSRDLGE